MQDIFDNVLARLRSCVTSLEQTELTEDDCRKIREYFGSDRFLLYEI